MLLNIVEYYKTKMIKHVPVLAKEVVENLPKNLKTYFDGTVGH
jgi:16S rRNA C1402 N4-methylase RsmH